MFESSSPNTFSCVGKCGNVEMFLVDIPIYNRWKGGKCGNVSCPEIHVYIGCACEFYFQHTQCFRKSSYSKPHLLGLLKSTPTLPMGRGGNFSESYTDLQLSLTQTSKLLE